MNNAGSFFSLSLYESGVKSFKGEDNDDSGKKIGGERVGETKGPVAADVRGQEDGCSKKEPQKDKTVRGVSEKKPVKKASKKATPTTKEK